MGFKSLPNLTEFYRFEKKSDLPVEDFVDLLERLLQSLFNKLPTQAGSGNSMTVQLQQLAGALKDQSVELLTFDDWLLTHSGESAALQAKNHRLARALAELELQGHTQNTEPLFEKARAIMSEPLAERRELLTDSLLIEAHYLCRSARERRDATQMLLKAIAGLEAFQSSEANAWRRRLRSAIENPSSKAVRELVAAAREWCAAELQGRPA
jgi:hypothetical protein